MALGVILAVAAVAGTGLQLKGQADQRRAAKKQNQINRRRENIEASRRRVSALREQRRQAASLNAQGAASGLGGSSAIQGATASLATSTAENIGQANRLDALGQESLKAQADINKAQALAEAGRLIQGSAIQGLNTKPGG